MFEKVNSREFGTQLEAFALQQLQQQGCTLVESNFQCKLGEIDLIVRDNSNLVFVEVRYRKQNTHGGADASVDRRKQNKLIRAASFYLQSKKLTNKVACRFDVFAIQGNLASLNYNWIKDAFAA